MTTMMETKGTDYITQWPHAIAKMVGISVDYISQAYADAVGTEYQRFDFLGSVGDPGTKEYRVAPKAVPEIGALEVAQAKAIVVRMKTIAVNLREASKTTCSCCGTALRNNTCPVC